VNCDATSRIDPGKMPALDAVSLTTSLVRRVRA